MLFESGFLLDGLFPGSDSSGKGRHALSYYEAGYLTSVPSFHSFLSLSSRSNSIQKKVRKGIPKGMQKLFPFIRNGAAEDAWIGEAQDNECVKIMSD